MTSAPSVSAVVDEFLVRRLGRAGNEPDWLTQRRLEAVTRLAELADPDWWDPARGPDLRRLVVQTEPAVGWRTEEGRTAGNRTPAGPGAVSRSQALAAFDRQRERLGRTGLVFCDLATAAAQHGDLVASHLDRVVASDGDTLGALTVAAWSGGTFLYVPPGQRIDVPLQSDDRVRSQSPAPFHRTVIVADEGASVHYVAGCAAPVYTADPVRSAMVEIVVGAGAEVTYTTVQNWSGNVIDATTIGAAVAQGGRLVLNTGNIGAKRTVRRIGVQLAGQGASLDCGTLSFAAGDQVQDTEIVVDHRAPATAATLISRSVANHRGRVAHRDVARCDDVMPAAAVGVEGDGLLIGPEARTAILQEVATPDRPSPTVSECQGAPVDEDLLSYLSGRGVPRPEAVALAVVGFLDPVISRLPTEYAVEWSRLIELQLQGAVG